MALNTTTPDQLQDQMQAAAAQLPQQQSQQPQQQPDGTQPQQDQQPAQQTPTQGQPAQQTVTNGQQQGQQQPQPNQPQQQMVSNTQPVPANHPAVQKASILRSVAETLAGGPRYTTTVDPSTGTTTRTPVPLTTGQIGMAIALSAISGSLAGLSQQGPEATGKAAAAGFQQVSQQQQQASQQQRQQAQQDLENRTAALTRGAQLHEINSRTILNTSEAEQKGADAIDNLAKTNRQSGVLDIDSSALDNNGQPMTQDELMDAMKAGKISPTDSLGPVAGRVQVTNPDGSQRWEATHLVIRDPNTQIPLTQQMWDQYANAGVPGFTKGANIGDGQTVKISMIQRANEVVASHDLANGRLADLKNTLDGTAEASKVPTSIDFTKPGVDTALTRFQKYVSHNAGNLADPYTALQDMGADKRDPQTGEMKPNPDAKYVDTVAQQFGGWSVLSAAHNQILANRQNAEKYSVIDTQDKAQAVLAAPKKFSQDQISAAHNFVSLTNQMGAKKAAAEARSRAVANGSDVEAMYRFGTNPVTGEKLTIGNAPDSMLVDPTGNVIPQNLVSTYKPTAQQRQTADTARQVLAISHDLQSQITQNPALIGPLAGRSKDGLAKLGLGDAAAQKLLDNVSLLQSAVTKMHTGRFSSEILKKSGNLIQPGMNVDQFNGAISSIQDVANRYANEDHLVTVSDFKQQQQPTAQPTQPQQSTHTGQQQQPTGQRVVPAGATPGRDKSGNIIGYRTADGQVVRF